MKGAEPGVTWGGADSRTIDFKITADDKVGMALEDKSSDRVFIFKQERRYIWTSLSPGSAVYQCAGRWIPRQTTRRRTR
jgi:hypothetical protein